MVEAIHAIETFYDGCRFRSRLEARWAVFFNAAKIRYVYEPEGFYSKDGQAYLPDFYLPDCNVYAEVKGLKPGIGAEIKRAIDVMTYNKEILIILPDIPNAEECGVFWLPVYYYHPLCGITGNRCAFLSYEYYEDDAHKIRLVKNFAVGIRCHINAWKPEFIEKEIFAKPDKDMKCNDDFPVRDLFDGPLLRSCFMKARQARFEYGETPEVST